MVLKIFNIIKKYLYKLQNGVPKNYIPKSSIEQSYFAEKKSRKFTIAVLFIITFITTTIAGLNFNNIHLTLDSSMQTMLFAGLSFSVPTILILLSHELGHYYAAKRFAVLCTPPYFIPFPLVGPGVISFGTMGAVIKIKSAIPDRRALFYIGVMGPLMGMIVSIVALVVGIYFSTIEVMPKSSSGLIMFGEPLLFKGLTYLILGPIGPGFNLNLAGPGWAGWFGCLITSLNLMPIGQLDGGHILYSLTGKRQVIVGWIAVAGLGIMSCFFMGWFIWVLFTFIFLMVGHPPVPEGKPLTLKEKILGWSVALLLLITFIPIPISM